MLTREQKRERSRIWHREHKEQKQRWDRENKERLARENPVEMKVCPVCHKLKKVCRKRNGLCAECYIHQNATELQEYIDWRIRKSLANRANNT